MGDPLEDSWPADGEFTGEYFHDGTARREDAAGYARGSLPGGEVPGTWHEPGTQERNQACLDQLEAYGREHPEFAAEWDRLVTAAADGACAQVAGARMAGQLEGSVTTDPVLVPVPREGFEPHAVFQAFGHAMLREILRRFEVMSRSSPGSPG